MYLSRTGNPLELFSWILLTGFWSIGGYLLVSQIFRLRSRERFFSGVASGLLLFIVTSNLLAHFISLTPSYWIAGGLILAAGLYATWYSKSPLSLRSSILLIWPQIAAFIGLIVLFTLINFGLSIFDDFANLPIVSTIAAGDVPPHFYFNPKQVLDYHYGMHLFAASLVRIAGMFPWSALDISKALSLALTMILSWLWFRRFIQQELAWLWVGLLVLFAGGARWLLLFIPAPTLRQLGNDVQLIGSALQSGPDLYSALIGPWKISGGGPIPFPFAFANGIYRPISMALGGSGALPYMTVFLLLLLALRRWRPVQGLFFGLIITSLALTSEHIFVWVMGGILLAMLIRGWIQRSFSSPLQWSWALFPGIILAPLMGGVLTALARRGFDQITGSHDQVGIALSTIALRWPPAFFSAHFGSLSLTDPSQLLIALVEMGPALFLAPWAIWYSREYIKSRKLLLAGLSLISIFSFLAPLFLRFTERDRDISRLSEAALLIWLVISLPYLWIAFRKGNHAVRGLISIGYGIVTLGGIVLFASQMVSIARPLPAYFISEPDVIMSKSYWNTFESNTWMLDLAYPYRAPTLFGCSTGPAYQNVYIPFPEFRELVQNPDPVAIANSGYRYVYLDRDTWKALPADLRQVFKRHCVELVSEQRDAMGDFRRLLDVRDCQTIPTNSAYLP